ncbi:tRNA adenosine(34) deaminase TadA [Coxiella endosymbiont of Ornithodoros amblus]|uniref:tRNA adenosine(34) deaminase TadA n=1 Tax=Coxiella endosymbiont of Ornithodoros amblus TaxID=1656166 RepID=UPI00244E430C|nr:tRNA adenosine(34) deaminase TadA [Coxiella endosymbiont of Ornithodoros amblus]MBW5802308.1 tRNA adenosine(34) deaminase TadA [Coxiella endosymbiont of Ornithodoros amblus]
MIDELFMHEALFLAKKANENNEVPIGAVLVKENEIVGHGFNEPIALNDPTAHAEILALRNAAKQVGNYRLVEATLYVTLEPCAMCVGAMIQARIKRLVFGAFNPRAGAVESVFPLLNKPRLNHRIMWTGGVIAEACAEPLKAFFRARR